MRGERQEGGCRPLVSRREPLLSVIVVVFRDRAELEKVIDNLAPFRSDDVEVVIIDGGSDDGSLEVLREQDDHIDYWLSEQDGGLYDGMNKGLAAARGRFLIHINAGDRLLNVPINLLASYGEGVDVLCCRVTEGGRGIWSARKKGPMRFQNRWHHQGTFYRRAAHLWYDTQYSVVADYDLNQRMLLARKRIIFSSQVVASHEMGGMSSNPAAYLENLRIIRANYGIFSYNVVRCLYFARHHYWTLRGRFGAMRTKSRSSERSSL